MISPERAIDAINDRYGRHAARALHAKGTVCRGTFTATPAAGALTRAAHMSGAAVDATVRFSNGSGDPRSADNDLDVRGMAVKFHLPDGSETDISAQTAERFPVRTPDAFIALVRANDAGRARLWRLPLFFATHPGALRALRAGAGALKPPASYATRRYHAIHAFRWVGSDGGERWVRYRWLPEAGNETVSMHEARRLGSDYLQDELVERLTRDPIRFALEVQIAADGDDPHDPRVLWPDERERIAVGTLEVKGVEPGVDGGVFDPVRVTDGIELSDDPILNYRPRAYAVSAERRTKA